MPRVTDDLSLLGLVTTATLPSLLKLLQGGQQQQPKPQLAYHGKPGPPQQQ
ncbi:hypothetical protein HaLaN_09214 [Haematococcus lacustris]|uniref:Uncharacterized protein n=1 Tax=Haematococcus lacustris TaxID=44745 RepID=A0A699Z1E1_HAELA|nr:hypothetical protein HaLaN_09214 [Haematococcus lacustris]